MNLSECIQAIRTEVKNLREDYHEARRLGNDVLAEEIADRIYELGFTQDQLFRAQLKSMTPLIEKYQNCTGVKELLLEYQDKLTQLVNSSTETNREFVIKWLENKGK
ncbi:hypothetical protein GF358_00215 [Candidatus Woesearchaeota archaeon]|nr:hypothetical protein [Candidatus Woesearchaeota archaeon]